MTIISQNLTMPELVDILAQKTQKFTQLLVDKKFDEEYKQCKETIQQVLAEIELRKSTTTSNSFGQVDQPNSF